MIKVMATPIPLFNCPTRRNGGPYAPSNLGPYRSHDGVSDIAITLTAANQMARTDYAACCGNTANDENGGGPTSLAAGDAGGWAGNPGFNGVIYQLSKVNINQISRGTSNVIMVSEKRMNYANYFTGQDPGDNECMYVGMDNDMNRTTINLPARDLVADAGNDTLSFGSSHLSGVNVLFGDGTVRMVTYDIDLPTWQLMGQIN